MHGFNVIFLGRGDNNSVDSHFHSFLNVHVCEKKGKIEMSVMHVYMCVYVCMYKYVKIQEEEF